MTSADFTVPDALLRAGEPPASRRPGRTDRLTLFARAIALIVAVQGFGGTIVPDLTFGPGIHVGPH